MSSMWKKVRADAPSIGGVWLRLEPHMRRGDDPAQDLGLWAQLTVKPGGVWSEARDETLVVERSALGLGQERGIWGQSADETLILERSSLNNVWETTAEETSETLIPGAREETPALWDKVGSETLILDHSETLVWVASLTVRDFSRYKPARAIGWALKKVGSSKGEAYWVLKNLRNGAYLKLNEQQAYLWNLMDGSRSVQDLAVELFIRYQTLSDQWLASFLDHLRARGFLVTSDVNVYRATGEHLVHRTVDYWVRRAVGILFRSELSIKSVDSFYSAVYKLIGPVLFSRVALILIWLVSLAGLPAFFWITRRGGLSFITGAGSSLTVGLAGLLAAQIFAVVVHESAHALTTKHYGRSVRRGGVGLYFGAVALFMDTTDIWMEPRGRRLAVTWAGPLSGFFLGGLASLALVISPTTRWAGPAYQLATFCYGISVLNLNPLLKLDGYYMLMDWLEMPMLRERSMAFVRGKLWRKLLGHEKLVRDDLIYTAFGILALAWTTLAIFSMLWLYGHALFHLLQKLAGSIVALVITILIVGYLAVRRFQGLLPRRRLSGV